MYSDVRKIYSEYLCKCRRKSVSNVNFDCYYSWHDETECEQIDQTAPIPF